MNNIPMIGEVPFKRLVSLSIRVAIICPSSRIYLILPASKIIIITGAIPLTPDINIFKVSLKEYFKIAQAMKTPIRKEIAIIGIDIPSFCTIGKTEDTIIIKKYYDKEGSINF